MSNQHARDLVDTLPPPRAQHLELSRELRDALDAAVTLEIRPSDEHVRTRAARSWDTLARHALRHMAREEERVFPDAILRGSGVDAVVTLLDDHSMLRALAKRIEKAGFVEPSTLADVADWMALWVRLFSAHARREETIIGEHAERQGMNFTE
jgi:hypothetical protein